MQPHPSLPSLLQADRHVEEPGTPNFDHVVLARQGGWEHGIRRLAGDDLPDRLVDGGHAAGDDEGHFLDRTVRADRHRHDRCGVRLLHSLAHHIEGHVQLDLPAHGLRVEHEVGVRVATPEEPAAAKTAHRRGRFLVELLADRAQPFFPLRLLLSALALGLVALRLLALGLIALGLITLGLFTLGLIPLGLFALGLFTLGLIALGLFALGLLTLCLLTLCLFALRLFALRLFALSLLTLGLLTLGLLTLRLLTLGLLTLGLLTLGLLTLGLLTLRLLALGLFALSLLALGLLALGLLPSRLLLSCLLLSSCVLLRCVLPRRVQLGLARRFELCQPCLFLACSFPARSIQSRSLGPFQFLSSGLLPGLLVLRGLRLLRLPPQRLLPGELDTFGLHPLPLHSLLLHSRHLAPRRFVGARGILP